MLACRARKDQKAKLVQLIREGVPGKVTLAIGDGANDVEMVNAPVLDAGFIAST